MTLSKNTLSILEKYQVDPQRGFLPKEDPPPTLPDDYKTWEDLASNFSDYLNAGIIREKILELPMIEHPVFQSNGEYERAMLLLSFFAHAYVNAAPEKRNHIPANISVPYIEVAKQLGRIPVLSHATLVLQNWKRLDKTKPIGLNNLALQYGFHGGLDESWFYLVTVQIEHTGAPAMGILLDGLSFLEKGNVDKTAPILGEVNSIIKKMTKVLKRMYEHCEPAIFYKRIRPFLDSFIEVEYQGTALGKQNFHGGSAAQSSLIQFFDAIMGNRYEDIPTTNHYLLEMRKYMPQKHADFLRFIETQPSYKSYFNQHPAIQEPCKKITESLIEFRNEHLKMVGIYIMQQAKASNQNAIGTGGTNPLLFLKSIRNKNEED